MEKNRGLNRDLKSTEQGQNTVGQRFAKPSRRRRSLLDNDGRPAELRQAQSHGQTGRPTTQDAHVEHSDKVLRTISTQTHVDFESEIKPTANVPTRWPASMDDSVMAPTTAEIASPTTRTGSLRMDMPGAKPF